MIIKDYLLLALKRWWLLALAFLVVTGSTYIWTSQQVPVYESHASFVIRPRTQEVSGDFLKALDTVSNRSEINSTFSEVAASKLIKNRAIKKLGLAPEQQIDLAVASSVVAGTNILEIRVTGHDPEVARDLADAAGTETVAYIQELYDIYQLETLDSANLPAKPVSPNMVLNLSLGAFLGLALGAAVIFLLEAFKPTYKELDTFNIIDRETGAYNKSYLTHRLFQEMARSRRARSPLSMGLVKVTFDGEGPSESERVEALRMVKILTEKSLREEDILARVNGVVFAVLFPNLPLDQARDSLQSVKDAIESVSHDMGAGRSRINGYMSAVAYSGNGTSHEKLLEQAFEGLNSVSPD